LEYSNHFASLIIIFKGVILKEFIHHGNHLRVFPFLIPEGGYSIPEKYDEEEEEETRTYQAPPFHELR